MSASSPAVGASPPATFRRLKAAALTGIAASLAALAGFGFAHALIIIPIWSQLLRGLPFALIGGVALAWAFDTLRAADIDRRPRQSGLNVSTSDHVKRGAAFGAVMFLTLVPVTALDTVLRLTGFRRADALEMAAALLLATGAGAAAGWWSTRRRDGVVAFAAGALGLLLAAAGPLPVAQSIRGLWLASAIGGICAVAGVTIAITRRLFGMDVQ